VFVPRHLHNLPYALPTICINMPHYLPYARIRLALPYA
jgi:hypothetical protein